MSKIGVGSVRCARKKSPQATVRVPLVSSCPGYRFERIALNIMGPMPTTESGNKYILVVGDYFTKWKEALAIPNQDPFKLFTSCTSSLSANYQRFLTHSLLKPQISIMSTLALQLGQHFMFQKFEQTMVNLIFDTMDLHYGMKLMRDLRF